MPFCSACGNKVDDNVAFCPACGNRIVTSFPPPATPQAATLPPPPPSFPSNFQTQPSYGENDRRALGRLSIFAITFLVSSIFGFVFSFGLNLFALPSLTSGTTSGANPFSFFSPGVLDFFVVYFLIETVLFVFGIFELQSSLRFLGRVDPIKFGLPSKLTIVLLIALPLVLLGSVVLLLEVLPVMTSFTQSQFPTGANVTSVSSNQIPPGLGIIAAAGFLILAAGIALLVGYIGGLMLGIWRIGSRFQEDILKVGAILFIIPLVEIVAPILIVIGAHNAKKKITVTH